MTDYWLGIDLGTTYTAAAIARPNGTTEMLGLGTRSLMIPSVVLVRDDGEILVGEAAARRAATEPARVAREFKRRLGDPSPLFLGGTPFSAEALMAHVLRHVTERATEREGATPKGTVITHPASWSPFKIDLLRDAVRQAGISGAVLMTEPEAAALHYGGLQRVAPGETVAVYDFGGGTFDSAVLTATAAGFSLTGTPEGIERLGGIDFDQAILSHVNGALGGALSELDPADPADSAALAELRDSCRSAKEALSEDTDATITVNLPGRPSTQLRITRSEFEELISPRIDDTVDVLERTIASSGRSTEDISRILPVGGSSRIPLVHQRIREATGLPLSFDTDPNLAIAQGAAALARQVTLNADAASVAPPPAAPPTEAQVVSASGLVVGAAAADTPAGADQQPATQASSDSKGRKPVLIGAVVAAIAVVALVAALASGGKSDDKTDDNAAKATSTTTASTEVTTSTSGDTEVIGNTAVASSTTAAGATTGDPVEYTKANGRTTRFGGFEWKVEGVTVGANEAGEPAVTVDLLATNVTDGDLTMIESPLMRFGADPVEVEGSLTSESGYPTATAGASARATYAFALPTDAAMSASALEGAKLIFGASKVLRAGIPLDGEAVKPVAVEPTPVNATLSIAGDANGDLTVISVKPALDAEATIAGSGDDEAADFRAAKDTVWLAFDVKLDCRGGTSGQKCYFGLEQDVFRVEVDGVAEGFESADSDLFEIDDDMPPGSTGEVLPQLMVKRGKSYVLLLGDPKDPAAVKRIPLDIGADVDSLFAPVSDFQP